MRAILSSFKRIYRLPQVTKYPKFFFADNQKVKPNIEFSETQDTYEQSSEMLSEESKSSIPVWLRSYDPERYEKPLKKIKYSTGYAKLDVEPFPRARIMKLCYTIMEKVKQIPEATVLRNYQEEKIKWIMEVTDETEDIQQIESALNVDCIELAIQKLVEELKLADEIIDGEFWTDQDETDTSEEIFFQLASKPDSYFEDPKNIREKRKRDAYLEEREDFSEEESQEKEKLEAVQDKKKLGAK